MPPTSQKPHPHPTLTQPIRIFLPHPLPKQKNKSTQLFNKKKPPQSHNKYRMQPLTNYGYLDQYQIIERLGCGFHGEVVVGRKDSQKYALKMFKGKTSDYENWKNEVETLKKLDHPNIVKFVEVREKGVYKTGGGEILERFVIVLEHVEGGELFYYLVVGRFSEGAARTYFRLLLDAISYMHGKGIAHRDIKPQNILLDQKFNLRVIDFGFSTSLSRGVLHTKCGTEAYMAPEIYNKNYEGKSVDYFAAGIILFLLYTGVPPFQKANELTDQYYKALYEKKFKKFWLGHTSRLPEGHLTDTFKNLIERMLAHDPEDRMTLAEIKEHPWMAGESLMLNEIHDEFVLRKQRVQEIHKMEVEFQRRKREEMKRFEGTGKTRSGGDKEDVLYPYIEKIKINYSELPEPQSCQALDLVINETPQNFIALLQYNLEHRTHNLIFSQQEIENFQVVVDDKNQQVAIFVVNSMLQNLQVESAKIHMKMFREKDGRMRVRFRRDEEGDELVGWKLVDMVREGFYYEL